MKRLTRMILRRFVPGWERTSDPGVRARYGIVEGWVSVVVNAILAAIKGALGLMTGSLAVMADAAHTLSDLAGSVVIIIGFRMSAKPGDTRHPFGHGRMEAVSALVVAVLLAVAAFEFAKGSIARLVAPRMVRADTAVIAVLVATIVVKEMLALFARDLGRRIKSNALEADFLHHRMDSISTVLVVANLIAQRYGVARADGAAGLAVSVIIAWSAWVIARDAVDPLIGVAPDRRTVRAIERIAREVEGARAVHDVIVQRFGELFFISLHVEMPASLSATQMHRLSEEVEARVTDQFGGLTIVHADPVDRDHPEYRRVEEIVADLVSKHPRLTSFHDLRLIGDRKDFSIVFNVVLDHPVDAARRESLRALIRESVRERCPCSRVTVYLETPFARSIDGGDE